MDRLGSRVQAGGGQWALGPVARSRALTTVGQAAAVQHARTRLVYGGWLRREGRRQAAREQLRTAHDTLSDMGADALLDITSRRQLRDVRLT